MGKSTLFEDVDLNLLAQDTRSGSFLTNEENLPCWILAIEAFHENTGDEVQWSFTQEQSKLLAQLKLTKQQSSKKQGILSISFYLSTHRILIQGGSCIDWFKNSFPIIKTDVQTRKSGKSKSSKEIIDQLINKNANTDANSDSEITSLEVTEDSIANVDILQSPITVTAAPDRITAVADIASKPNLTPTRRRSLPTTPSPNTSNLTKSLKIAVEKLIKENVELKYSLHDVENKLEKLESENSTHDNEIKHLNNTVKDLNKKLEKLEDAKCNCQHSEIQEDIVKNKDYQDLKKQTLNMKDDINELFVRSRHTQEEFEKRQSENDLIKLKDDLKIIQQILNASNVKITELENSTNEIQSQIFDGIEVVNKHNTTNQQKNVHKGNHSQQDVYQGNPTQRDVHQEPTLREVHRGNPTLREYREIKRNENNLVHIYGDSNTKGLDKKKLKVDINSLSGATIDSAITHFQNTLESHDNSTKGIIFHLGSNNLKHDSTDTIKEKINKLAKLTSEKYPNATNIAMCEIPKWKSTDNQKIIEINTFIKDHAVIKFIQLQTEDKHFQQDGLHYNKHGLAIVAINIKKWIISHNLRNVFNKIQNENNATSASTPSFPQRLYNGPQYPLNNNWPFMQWPPWFYNNNNTNMSYTNPFINYRV